VTRFTDLVGCRHPIQLAAMSRTVSPALAAGVSNLGGLGMLAIGRPTRADAEATLDEVLALTSLPVGAGFIVEFLDRAILADVAARVPIIEHFWGWPDASIVPHGVITGWQVGSVDEAKAAVDAGCQYVVAQGVEAGGHVRGTTPLRQLLHDVLAAVDIPVVAAGGIGTAADVREMLTAGADAVRVGTRFAATVESDLHDRYVERLCRATAADTVLTEAFGVGWPHAPHRVLASALQAALAAPDGTIATMTLRDGSTVDLPRFSPTPPSRSTTGAIEAMALYAGRSVGAVTSRAFLADVMAELIEGTTP
jgi:nitronate monooxygenase